MGGQLLERTAAEQAERAIARTFVATRAGQLAFSAFMVIGDRRRFKRPKLQVVLLAGTVIESTWLSYRILRADRYQDRTAQWVDTAWAAGGLIACQLGLGPGGGAPWMKNIAIGAAIGAGACEDPVDRAGILTLLGLAGAAAGVRAKGRDTHVAGLSLAVNDIINWTGSHTAVSTYVAAHRRQARLRDEADGLALENATKAAAESERSQQHRLVHQRTVEVLVEMATSGTSARPGNWPGKRPAGSVTSCAPAVRCPPTSTVPSVRWRSRPREGLHIELVTAELLGRVAPEAEAPVRQALEMAVLAAHELAGADRGVVRAASEPELVTVTVRHHVGGFSPGDGSPYDQRLAALAGVLSPVGGRVEVWSEEGRGVRVTLVVPTEEASGRTQDTSPPWASQTARWGTVRFRCLLYRAAMDHLRPGGRMGGWTRRLRRTGRSWRC